MPAPDYATEIAALQAAAASGELTIESNGERVTYRSTTDLLMTLDYFRGLAARASGSTGSASTLASYEGF